MAREALPVLGILAAVVLCGPAQAQTPPPYRDPALSVEARAADLVSRMTLEEKAPQLGNTAPAIPRLGVPRYNWWNEGLHGVAAAGVATVFPQAVGLAATFDAPLTHEVADVIGVEFRAKYVENLHPDGGSDWFRGLTVWSPNINIFRDPRWGRGQETYGEDPFLTSRIGVAFIRGLQGDDPKYLKALSTAKHYAVHSGPESNRHREDVHPSPHDLEDTYLPAFRAAVVEGRVQGIMCAYNAVDGVPACASEALMDTRLRRDWGFTGHVVSDCGGAANIYREDALRYTRTPEEAVALAFEAGMDLICGDYRNEMTTEVEPIIRAVRSGALSEATVDRALRRLFEARIRLGMFDPPATLPFAKITPADNDTPAHRALSLRTAKAAMVLLKNDGLLPLKAAPARIAVIGPNADSVDALTGNYSGTPSKPVTVLAGLRARYPTAQVTYVQGTDLIGPTAPPVPDAALCVDPDCRTPGLKAEHFAGTDLAGAPTLVRNEANARLSWRDETRETSVRWTGTLVTTKPGEHRFRVASRNGYRVWVDGRLLVDEWDVTDKASIADGAIELAPGRHAIRVEAFQRGRRGEQQLVWSLPGGEIEAALQAARDADLIVFAGGLTARVEGEELRVQAPGFSRGDRTSLDLPGPQQALLEQLHATGKPVILVLMNGSAMSVNWADRNVPAIIEAWYPGGEGGHAVAGLIAGDYSPAGRLPVTFYRSADDLPPFSDYAMKGRTYRYFTGEALYPFGHGLSFTRFRYAKVRVDSPRIRADGTVTVSADVTNTGGMDGDEVVQLYLTHPGQAGAPVRALAGFERVHLKRGETRTVRFTLSDRALSLVDEAGQRAIRPGPVEVWVGGGQPLSRAGLAQPPGGRTRFSIAGTKPLPR